MLQPYVVTAPVEGELTLDVKPGQSLGSGILLARIRSGQGQEAVEVRSPFAGMVEQILARDKSHVSPGQPLLSLAPGADQVSEALRGLYLVGQPEDLADVERYKNSNSIMPEKVRQQAGFTAQAIRTRAEQHPSP